MLSKNILNLVIYSIKFEKIKKIKRRIILPSVNNWTNCPLTLSFEVASFRCFDVGPIGLQHLQWFTLSTIKRD